MTPRARNRGFALVTAVFVLVVLATAALFMVAVSGAQRQTVNFAVLGPRAYWAARSGLEWASYQVLTAGTGCPATTTFPLTQGSLNGFQVRVSCTSSDHVEVGVSPSPETVYRVTSFAWRGTFGDRDYVSRQLQATVY